MILIADSGSTKCDWVLYENKGQEPFRIRTKGLNPAILNKKDLNKIITKNLELAKFRDRITSIYFFGAGCGTRKNQKKIDTILTSFFKKATTIVKEDTMAAVWATTNTSAVVCILGTGSNCCYFDGEHIHSKTPSLGYIVMDEASGNYYGKELLKSYYYKQMPPDLRFSFEKNYNLKPQKVVRKIYESSTPNKYLADFARFIFDNIEHPFIIDLLKKGISKFIENHLMQYSKELKSVPIHFVGSIAYHARKFITDELNKKGLVASSFVRRPIESLKDSIFNKNIT